MSELERELNKKWKNKINVFQVLLICLLYFKKSPFKTALVWEMNFTKKRWILKNLLQINSSYKFSFFSKFNLFKNFPSIQLVKVMKNKQIKINHIAAQEKIWKQLRLY